MADDAEILVFAVTTYDDDLFSQMGSGIRSTFNRRMPRVLVKCTTDWLSGLPVYFGTKNSNIISSAVQSFYPIVMLLLRRLIIFIDSIMMALA